MMCQSNGLPPTSTIGFGRYSVSSRMRMPCPPARIITLVLAIAILPHVFQKLYYGRKAYIGAAMFASGKSNRHFMDGESQPFCLNHCLSVNEPVFRLQVQTLKSRSPKHFRLAIYIHAREAEEHIEKTVVNGADYSSLQSISTLIAYSLDEIVITVERCLKNLCGVGGAYLFVSIGVTDEFATGGFQAGLNSAAVSSILCEFDELNFRKLERKCLCSLWRCIERTVKHKNEFEVGTL